MRRLAILTLAVAAGCAGLAGLDEYGVATVGAGGSGGARSVGGAGGSGASGGVGTGAMAPGGAQPAYEDVVLADMPVAYWRLEESTGAALDEINDIRATPNDPSIQQGVAGLLLTNPGSAFYFPAGANELIGLDVVDMIPNADFTDSFSIEVWIDREDGEFGRLVSKVDGATPTEGFEFAIGGGATDTVSFTAFSAPMDQVVSANLDSGPRTILHLVVVVQPTMTVMREVKIYANGGGVVTDVIPFPPLLAPGPLRIGRSFAGRLDEVAIYDDPLSDAQVADHWAAGSGMP